MVSLVGQVSGTSVSGNNITLTVPAGIANGDIVLIVSGTNARAANEGRIGNALAYQEIANQANGIRGRVAWKAYNTADGTTVTVEGSGSVQDAMSATMSVWRGAPATPFYVSAVVATGNSTNPNPGAITPISANDAIVALAVSAVNDVPTTGANGSYTIPATGASSATDNNPASSAFEYQILAGGAGVSQDPPAFPGWNTATWVAFTVDIASQVIARGTLAATLADITAAGTGIAVISGQLNATVAGITSDSRYGPDAAGVTPFMFSPTAPRQTAPPAQLPAPTNLAVGSPVFGTPVSGRNYILTPAAFADSSPVLGTAGVTQKHVLAPDFIGLSPPVFGTPALGQKQVIPAASNLATGSPVFGAPATAVGMTATALAVSSPALGTPAFTHRLTLPAPLFLTANSPVLGTPVMVRRYTIIATALVPGAPVFGTPALAIINPLAALDHTVGSPAFGAPAIAQTHNLAVPSPLLVFDPVFGTPVFGYVAAFAGDELSTSSPEVGFPGVGQTHALGSLWLTTNAPFFATPSLFLVSDTDLVLGARVLDFGLSKLTEADQMLVCSTKPTTYTEALSYALGHKTLGAGNVFGASEPATDGPKATSAAITLGVVDGDGDVGVWAAVDTVNERLLATAELAEPISISTDRSWSLPAIVVHLPR